MIDVKRTAAQLAHCMDMNDKHKCDTCPLQHVTACTELLMSKALEVIQAQAESLKPHRVTLEKALTLPIVWIEDRTGVRAVRLRKVNECAIGVARFSGNFFVDIDETKKWAIWDKEPGK